MNTPLEAVTSYYWSKIRQAIDALDYSGVVYWSLAARRHSADVADAVLGLVDECKGPPRFTEQTIADVANAKEAAHG